MVPHGLGHTAATLILDKGWDVKIVAQLLGHTTVTITFKDLEQRPGEPAGAISTHP